MYTYLQERTKGLRWSAISTEEDLETYVKEETSNQGEEEPCYIT